MRYPPQHKLATRRRILAAASAAFRERGVEGTGVDEVMRRAGLTHGGFYSHFRDKSELVAEACAEAFDEAVVNLARISAQPTSARRARLLIDSYLSTHHRDNRGSGCLVVAVGADMARLSGAARSGYARGFARHIDRLCAALRLAPDPDENRDRVTHLMSSLVGALIFARAMDDRARSDALLESSRRMLRKTFASVL
ncbi:MAG: TetR/AcrR family transcriptional regulator [Verrucomicrobia bacterium]|nr:TetR/AcrR family transcriptional regulator [Verrucomicrobiota bacterium]